MDRSNGYYYSDSDDDRHSTSQSTASEDTEGTRLPSSLRKLLNPMIPPAQQSLAKISQASGSGSVKHPGACPTKEELLVVTELSRLRPWQRLPPPRPLNAQPQVPLPPFLVRLPPTRSSNDTIRSCSPRSTRFSPYYVPGSHSFRGRNGRANDDRTGRVNNCQVAYQHEPFETHDTQPSPFIPTPSNPRPLSIGMTHTFQSNTQKKLNTYPASQVAMTPRPELQKTFKKPNKANDKNRNRCLTCGGAFSTFANLTRHEKKCQ